MEKQERNLEKIHDEQIKNCMLRATKLIDLGELKEASNKIYEALAAFIFMMVGFFSDFRVADIKFEKMTREIDFPNLLADMAFKIIFGGDERAFNLLMNIGSNLRPTPEGEVQSISTYSYPILKDKNEVWEHYNEVLRIILSYQDRIPRSKWRV